MSERRVLYIYIYMDARGEIDVLFSPFSIFQTMFQYTNVYNTQVRLDIYMNIIHTHYIYTYIYVCILCTCNIIYIVCKYIIYVYTCVWEFVKFIFVHTFPSHFRYLFIISVSSGFLSYRFLIFFSIYFIFRAQYSAKSFHPISLAFYTSSRVNYYDDMCLVFYLILFYYNRTMYSIHNTIIYCLLITYCYNTILTMMLYIYTYIYLTRLHNVVCIHKSITTILRFLFSVSQLGVAWI